MRIIIVGAGLVGVQLAQRLIQEKHDVSLIESNEERARYASNRLDCMVLHEEGNNLRVLEEAGITKADALVCVTGSDEVNMITSGLAASKYPKLLKIARVRNDDYARLNKTGERILGIDYFVHPDVEVSKSVLNAIEHGVRGGILAFEGTPYYLGSIDVTPGCAFDGLAVKDYRKAAPEESLITLVERGGKTILPDGATVLAKEDRIHILAREEEMDQVFKLSGRVEKPLRSIGIVGGGRVGALIAEGLLEKDKKAEPLSFFSFFKNFIRRKGYRVVIIEQDRTLCKELASRFPEALILNEDISEESFAAEEQIDNLDLIITTTDKQELNIITAVYLKSRNVDKAIALVTGPGYAAIARQLGVDVVIPMKRVVADSILSHFMGGGVKEVHRVGEANVDIIEVEISKDAPVKDKAISNFRLSAGGLLMLVNRDGNSFIPRGDYVFKEGDHIVLIANTGSQAEIEKHFGAAL
jgi:trk system potassium uptake protein TrkA